MNFPKNGTDVNILIKSLKAKKDGDLQWKLGRAFSYVYYADPEITSALYKAYEIYFSENGLNPSVFPSLKSMESEVIGMCIDLFNGSKEAVGLMTCGGTESILMAIKSAKEYAYKMKGIEKGELIMPVSAHPAFNKACNYFGIKNISVETGNDFRAVPELMEKYISENTIMLVGSAPSYPQGVVDPIPEIGRLGKKHEIPVHVDSCVGGFVLPFIQEATFPDFDLSVEGVTSLSADIHKYGFASKGSSVLLYNDPELRKSQFYVYTDWPGGIYASPSILGTKPGGAIAVAWTILKLLGMEGYQKLVAKSMRTAKDLHEFINSFDELHVFGKPDMCIFSIGTVNFDIYELGDELQELGWHLDRQQDPSSLHLSISPIHAEVLEEFKTDFIIAYNKAKKTNIHTISKNFQIRAAKSLKKVLSDKYFKVVSNKAINTEDRVGGRSAAIYGMMGELRGSGSLDEMIVDFLDQMTRPSKNKKGSSK